MSPKPYWTKELVFEAFANWEQEHKRLPTSIDWRKTQPDRKFKKYPSSRHVATMFGTWKQAVAEYEQSKNLYRKRWKIWSREDVIEAFQRWNEEVGHPPTRREVESREQGGRLPSMTSIYHHFEDFRAAIVAAGFRPLPRGVSRHSVERFKPLSRKER